MFGGSARTGAEKAITEKAQRQLRIVSDHRPFGVALGTDNPPTKR